MILVDVNLLIYAVNEDAPLHGRAKSWLENTLSGTETVGFAWIVILAFLRLTTRAGVFRSPLSVPVAFRLSRRLGYRSLRRLPLSLLIATCQF